MKKYIQHIILILSVAIFISGIVFSNFDMILISICGVILNNIIYCMKDFSERIIFLVFNISFFTFLVGRLIVKRFGLYEDINNNHIYGLDFDNPDITAHIFISVFISILFVFIGYFISNKKYPLKDKVKTKLNLFKDEDIRIIASISKIIFYITIVCTILVLIDKIKFTDTVGYMELYSSYTSSLPSPIIKLSQMSSIALFIYLGTLPIKKKSIIPIGLYIFCGVLSLIIGQRNNFVLNIMIIMVYFCLRNTTDRHNPWFGKKEIIAIVGILPIMIILLNTVSYARLDKDAGDSSLMGSIHEFLYKQGVSVNLIGYAETLEDELPEGKNYTFGRVIDFAKENAITRLIFDTPVYKPQTVESAIYGNSFADSVSYILSPKRYVKGWGYGSSYIAELYKDFGYIGITIGSLALGLVLGVMGICFKLGPILAGIALFMTRLILYSPRDTATSFIVTSFSLINILTIVIILVIWKILKYYNSKKKTARVSVE